MDIFKGLFGGRPGATPVSSVEDADFADFASAPSPVAAAQDSISSVSSAIANAALPTSTGASIAGAASTAADMLPRPYTKWYRVWERVYLRDFYTEMFILPFIVIVVFVHMWGSRTNRRKAANWLAVHKPSLQSEFASVGFTGRPGMPASDDEALREKNAAEYSTYATGRTNVAFLDAKLTLYKRYNPASLFAEYILAFFMESQPAPKERLEATEYVFDGREADLVPLVGGKNGPEAQKQSGNSSVDGFVFAIIHKDCMKRLRDGRYDLSLTITKDHAKLPNWATVMSESAEITEAILTPELVKCVEQAGEAFEGLIISDMPIDGPKKLNDLVPRKRISLSLLLPGSDNYASTLPMFNYFLRLPDQLAGSRFRPEAMRRVKTTREDEARKLRKVDDDEKAEERRVKGEKDKKEKRDLQLRGMSADEQKKFLDKERERENKRMQKKRTTKG